jgi:hypothetical protein
MISFVKDFLVKFHSELRLHDVTFPILTSRQSYSNICTRESNRPCAFMPNIFIFFPPGVLIYRNQQKMDSSGSFDPGNDSHLNINGTNLFSYLRKLHSKY